ncbi:MAG: hypothetical protein KJ799_05110 [Bacteroidetes bacterium]|nr:hypothetical protein [Bacteroidota bacterium]MBU1677745.1 hypothetical protein [Bacteroidota bacterium]MBU2506086.1 hypothetical protein [Bacteroidota bacterium]
MKLKIKILSGFIILAIMLLIAGSWSIYKLTEIGNTVENVLKENYESVNIASKMRHALEREDSAILMFLLGETNKADSIFSFADIQFMSQLNFAKKNITLSNEENIINNISVAYNDFVVSWQFIQSSSEIPKTNYYVKTLHKKFLEVTSSLDNLSLLNETAMYSTAVSIKDKATRAIVPGIVAIISALLFVLMFNYFINFFVVNPIKEFNLHLKRFINTRQQFDYLSPGKDELSELSESIRIVCSYVPPKSNSRL